MRSTPAPLRRAEPAAYSAQAARDCFDFGSSVRRWLQNRSGVFHAAWGDRPSCFWRVHVSCSPFPDFLSATSSRSSMCNSQLCFLIANLWLVMMPVIEDARSIYLVVAESTLRAKRPAHAPFRSLRPYPRVVSGWTPVIGERSQAPCDISSARGVWDQMRPATAAKARPDAAKSALFGA